MHVPGGMVVDGMVLVFMQVCFHCVLEPGGVVSASGGGANLPTLLMEEGRAMLLSTDSNHCMVESVAFTSCIELADDVASHVGVHVNLIILGYINCPPIS